MRTPPTVSAIVPIFNSFPLLSECLQSLRTAATYGKPTELVLVDNGSSDGSFEYVLREFGSSAKVAQLKGVTIGALRNFGAAKSAGSYLLFLDSDCVIEPDYFEKVRKVFEINDCDATGSMVVPPTPPHWIERVWHGLHRRSKDGYVNYINSGNFVVRKSAFDQVKGFDEELQTGEDAELGQKLRLAGFKIFEAHELAAVHLRNPNSLRQFFKKEVWRGLGAFGTARGQLLDKPLAMTLLHLVVISAGTAYSVLSNSGLFQKAVLLITTLSVVPVLALIFRSFKLRRLNPPLHSALLYFLYFTARAASLLILGYRSVRGNSQ